MFAWILFYIAIVTFLVVPALIIGDGFVGPRTRTPARFFRPSPSSGSVSRLPLLYSAFSLVSMRNSSGVFRFTTDPHENLRVWRLALFGSNPFCDRWCLASRPSAMARSHLCAGDAPVLDLRHEHRIDELAYPST